MSVAAESGRHTAEEWVTRVGGLKRVGQQWQGPCPLCREGKDRFWIKDGDGKVLVGCRRCGSGPEWFRKLRSQVFETNGHKVNNGAIRYAEPKPRRKPPRLTSPSSEPPENLRHPKLGTPSKTWQIRDHGGSLWAVHARFDPPDDKKVVLWWRNDRWSLEGLSLKDLPLWGSESLQEASISAPVYLTEGEKAAEALRGAGVPTVATVTGSSSAPELQALEVLRDRQVVLWPDRDTPGRKHMDKVAAALEGIAAEVRMLDPATLEGLPLKAGKEDSKEDGADAVEWLEHRDSQETETLRAELMQIATENWKSRADAGGSVLASRPKLRSLTLRELIALNQKPQDSIAGDLFMEESLNMVHAPRGKGKSWFIYALGLSIASGGKALCDWEVPTPRKVLLVDGEMSTHWLQQRGTRLALGCGAASLSPDLLTIEEYQDFLDPNALVPTKARAGILDQLSEIPLRVLSNTYGHRVCQGGIPDLDTAEGRKFIEDQLGDAQVLILDNLSSLFRSGEENEAAAWAEAGAWLIRLRAQGLMVVLVHHSGKSGDQRGTSRREDPMDVILKLEEPEDFDDENGCQLIATLTKARHLSGATAGKRRLDLKPTQGGGLWFDWRFVAESQKAEALELYKNGKSFREIAKVIGSSKSTVARWVKEPKR